VTSLERLPLGSDRGSDRDSYLFPPPGRSPGPDNHLQRWTRQPVDSFALARQKGAAGDRGQSLSPISLAGFRRNGYPVTRQQIMARLSKGCWCACGAWTRSPSRQPRQYVEDRPRSAAAGSLYIGPEALTCCHRIARRPSHSLWSHSFADCSSTLEERSYIALRVSCDGRVLSPVRGPDP